MRAVVWVVALVACGSPTVNDPDAPITTIACTTESDCTGATPYCEPTSNVCVECRFNSHCADSVCDGDRCRTASSCKELHMALPGLGNGVYSIDPDGSGPIAAYDAYCDMTTDGGGWTALLNATALATPRHADLMAATTVISGTQSCESATVPNPFIANGFHGIGSYACGVVTFRLELTWANTLGATDVMFIGALQGETTRTLTINGTPVAPDATTTDATGATCVFFNGQNMSATLSTNTCHGTYLNASPHVVNGALSGDLALAITTGPACAPTCNHGTGMNIQKLFVR